MSAPVMMQSASVPDPNAPATKPLIFSESSFNTLIWNLSRGGCLALLVGLLRQKVGVRTLSLSQLAQSPTDMSFCNRVY